jgi:hypothetical protein
LNEECRGGLKERRFAIAGLSSAERQEIGLACGPNFVGDFKSPLLGVAAERHEK